MKKVYLASPYTLGDVAVNVKHHMDVASELLDLGYAVYAPLLTHFLHMAHPRPYEQWLKLDQAWLSSCDAILRLPGRSGGADGEVELARTWGMPVYYSIATLLEGCPPGDDPSGRGE